VRTGIPYEANEEERFKCKISNLEWRWQRAEELGRDPIQPRALTGSNSWRWTSDGDNKLKIPGKSRTKLKCPEI
jgi:hypothetical protein